MQLPMGPARVGQHQHHTPLLFGVKKLFYGQMGWKTTGTKLPAFLSPSLPLSFPSNTFLYSPGWI